MEKEVDIVLSGSGVKMTAFAGALKAIEEYGYIVKRICGTSGGSIVASLYAFGYSPDEIFDIISKFQYKKWLIKGILWPFPFAPLFRWGVFSSKPIEKELHKHIAHGDFNSDSIICDLTITGANLDKGEVIYFNKNNDLPVAKAARISSTVPFGYSYVKYNNEKYVDGGLLNNFPINIFDDNKRETIGLLAKSLHQDDKKAKVKWPWQYLMAILNACIVNTEKEHISNADWARTIPLDVSDITSALNPFLTLEEHKDLFQAGYEITKKRLSLRTSS